MALSFAANGSAALSSWGFSAGDIAAMIGAGRAVGSWLMAAHNDRGFLSFLDVTPDDILRRKGLINVVALHRRWDNELTLLRNGSRIKIQHPTQSGAIVENMDRLTWLMTLIVAALDATVDSRAVRKTLQDLMIKILHERMAVGGEELLIHGLNQHVEGWRSAGCVRGISLEARAVWRQLEIRQNHLPGNIPENDCPEICRLLFWIATGQDNRFITTSTDVHCLAVILAKIGLEDHLKTTSNIQDECDESQMLVVLDKSHIQQAAGFHAYSLQRRRGMRIPLEEMEESVSIWGGDTSQGNARRDIFITGMRASEGVKLTVARKTQTLYLMDEELLDVYYIVQKSDQTATQRLGKDLFRLLASLFLHENVSTATGLQRLVKTWPPDSITKIGWWLQDLRSDRDTEEELRHLDATSTKHLTSFIIFILGYYYAILRPLLNTTELGEQEAIGSWGYDDIQLLRVFRAFKESADPENEGRFPRHALLRLLGYMFAGANYTDQLQSLPERSIGVLGKLVLVTGSLMGEADCPEKVEKFWLLDVDQSCIPCNPRGIVLSGKQLRCRSIPPEAKARTLDLSSQKEPRGDFTSHIEPDWEYDVQRVLVAYRHAGRLVHRLSPIDCDIAVIKSWVERSESTTMVLSLAIPVDLKEFHGSFIVKIPEQKRKDEEFQDGYIMEDERSSQVKKTQAPEETLVAMTHELTKARTCITGMYGANVGALSSNDLEKAANEMAPVIVIA